MQMRSYMLAPVASTTFNTMYIHLIFSEKQSGNIFKQNIFVISSGNMKVSVYLCELIGLFCAPLYFHDAPNVVLYSDRLPTNLIEKH